MSGNAVAPDVNATPTFFINGEEVTDPDFGTPSFWGKRLAALAAEGS